MWDSLFANADFLKVRILPSGVLWSLDRVKADRGSLSIGFKEHGKTRSVRLDVDPTYFSMADEWIEAYGGMESKSAIKFLKSGLSLEDVKKNIGDTFPSERITNNALELYLISAMEWTIRIASLEPPKITEIQHAH